MSVSYLGDELVSYRQLDFWVRQGYLRPGDHPMPGSGKVRSWPTGEVAVARLMGRLVKAGLTPAAAHRVARGDRVLGSGIRIVIDEEVQ